MVQLQCGPLVLGRTCKGIRQQDGLLALAAQVLGESLRSVRT